MQKISFIIPCYGSEKTITEVINEIEKTMEQLRYIEYEAILVNDCSPDNVLSSIREICSRKQWVKGLDLAKNFGQHSAIMAGMNLATGDIVVFLDDDGQTPIDEVGKLLNKLDDGYDVVYAKYTDKKHSFGRNLGSRVNDFMAQILLGKPKGLYVSSYFVCKKFICDEMLKYRNAYPYLYGLVLRTTNNITNVDVNHRERENGKSGYTIKKLIGLWLNGFTAFSVLPLRVATIMGAGCAFSGFLYGVYIVIDRLVNPGIVAGYSSLMAGLLFIGGMIMLMLGLIGEYVGRIYISINASPQFVVREQININTEEKI